MLISLTRGQTIVKEDKDGYLNRKADLMEKLVRRMQMTASQSA